MPAPNLETLFDFETQLEQAVIAILRTASIPVLDPYLPIDPNTNEPLAVPDDGVLVEFDIGASTGDHVMIVGSNGEAEYSVYDGRFTLDGYVPVSPAASGAAPDFVTKLRARRAACRTLFLESKGPFDSTNLPWLDVLMIRPSAPQRGADQPRAINWFRLSWDFRFAIVPTAWPV